MYAIQLGVMTQIYACKSIVTTAQYLKIWQTADIDTGQLITAYSKIIQILIFTKDYLSERVPIANETLQLCI